MSAVQTPGVDSVAWAQRREKQDDVAFLAQPVSGPREGLFSRQCFSWLGALPMLSSTKCQPGIASLQVIPSSTRDCPCCGCPASLVHSGPALRANTSGTWQLGWGFGTTTSVESSLPQVAMPATPCLYPDSSFPLTSCYRVYQGPKVNEERRWVRPIIWGSGLPCGNCHESPNHVPPSRESHSPLPPSSSW